MIHEFALDPTILSTWEKVRYLIEKFGCEHGRMISEFPKKSTWKRLVYDACVMCKDYEKKHIEVYLANIDKKLIRQSRTFDGTLPWLQNAEAQHSTSPFHAIISGENPNRKDFVLIENELSDEVPLWNVKRGLTVPRTASEMVKCVQPLLQVSTEILFIDRHFKPYEIKYRNVLAAFANVMASNDRITRIEYHGCLERDVSLNFFRDKCEQKLKSLLPRGMKISFLVWEQIEGSETLHPRYVLTDLGGIRIEHGLDEGNDGETTDIALLDSNIYAQRWRDYQRNTSPFRLIDEIAISS